MPAVRDDAKGIVSTLETLNENIKRGFTPELPEPIKSKIKRILSLDPEKDGRNIMEIYDDLLDDFIGNGIDFPL